MMAPEKRPQKERLLLPTAYCEILAPQPRDDVDTFSTTQADRPDEENITYYTQYA